MCVGSAVRRLALAAVGPRQRSSITAHCFTVKAFRGACPLERCTNAASAAFDAVDDRASKSSWASTAARTLLRRVLCRRRRSQLRPRAFLKRCTNDAMDEASWTSAALDRQSIEARAGIPGAGAFSELSAQGIRRRRRDRCPCRRRLWRSERRIRTPAWLRARRRRPDRPRRCEASGSRKARRRRTAAR